MGIRGINLKGTREEHRDSHIKFCALHAAAPELLASLERLIAIVEPTKEAWDDTSRIPDAFREAMAAVAKAKGG